MQNKNPQGNFDPIPDSDQELEKYGVWVKAEPQDVVEEPETEHQPLIAESNASLEPLEELSDEIEELEEMQSFDESDTETFEDLAPLDEEEPSMMMLENEAAESIDLSDFGLDEPEGKTESEQSFDEIAMDLDLDEELSADLASDDEMAFGFDSQDDSGSGIDLAFDSETSEHSGELLPEIEMENIEIKDGTPVPSFDDVGALEEDLASSSPSENYVPNDLLQKIALELSSIKEELVSLRSQLGELKREPVPTRLDEEEVDDENAKGGFFDDEDDDTIALTGDELDNILNTADFTVEPPEDLSIPESLDETDIFGTPGIPAESEAIGADWNVEAQDLLPEDGSYISTEASESAEPEETLEPGIETIEGDEALDLDFGNEDEVSPIDMLPEINVITESPEDTSYLDEEAAELSDGFELGASPLDEVPLVEPDLTELDIGTEIDDAIAADSAEDLPFMESADDDEGELIIEEDSEALPLETASENDQKAEEDDNFDTILDLEEADDEIVLSIDGDDQTTSFESGDFTGSIEEIEEPEPLSMDPFQDEIVSELELHKEGSAQDDTNLVQEPEDILQVTQAEEFEDLESLDVDKKPEEANEESFEDLGMDFEDEGLLGSQEVEDLGGEELGELEDLGVEELEALGSEELEVLDEEVL